MDDHVQLNPVGDLVAQAWREIPTYFAHVELDAHEVMPIHVHGILILKEKPRAKRPPPEADASPLQPKGTLPGSVRAIVQMFKAIAARCAHFTQGTEAIRLWQRGSYEHVVRGDEELNRLRRYIEENPLRSGSR